jgi:hypothetical protein
MKTSIIIAGLTVISVFSLGFGIYQKYRADKNELQAKEMRLVAEVQKHLAGQQRAIAEANQQEAERQRVLSVMSQREAERQKALAVENEIRAVEKTRLLEACKSQQPRACTIAACSSDTGG